MRRRTLLALAFVILSLTPEVRAAFVSFSTGGDATTASIQGTVDAFRAALGNPNNANNPGPVVGGRREINWDGGGAATTVSPTPFTGFTNIRGATFNTPGTGFVQAPPSGLATQFANATYTTTFGAFSAQRVFTPIGSNITDVTFSIPGTNGATPAVVPGFGAVFTDVETANLTRLQFFDINNVQIFNQTVAPGTVSNASLSFLGAIANAGEQIARVRITTGNAALGGNDAPTAGLDLVVMDDFLYGEPVAAPGNGNTVPSPTSLGAGTLLAAVLLLGFASPRARRRHV